jgi:hypothetical protein
MYTIWQPWCQCYVRNFLRFLPIVGEKTGFLLNNQCYI